MLVLMSCVYSVCVLGLVSEMYLCMWKIVIGLLLFSLVNLYGLVTSLVPGGID